MLKQQYLELKCVHACVCIDAHSCVPVCVLLYSWGLKTECPLYLWGPIWFYG